ncbi:MAG TPA: response regulator [Candidatus Sulfopaludibacter sp.]|jgi:YesN/AraC family two-component response regulator|nr:response regulator [Candidatus Sulfopaludibacter sp.]
MSRSICLVVDDEPLVRSFLKLLLQRENMQVLEAESAAQASDVIAKLDGCVQLLITDIEMPGEQNGLQLADLIRDSYPAIAILVISGYRPDDFRHSGRTFEFMRKPFSARALLDTAERLLRERNVT